jgi:hypothetical protein
MLRNVCRVTNFCFPFFSYLSQSGLFASLSLKSLCSQELFGTPISQVPMHAGLVWHPYLSSLYARRTCLASLSLKSLCSQDLFGIPMLAGLVWHAYLSSPYARRTCLASLCSQDSFGIPISQVPMLAGLVWHPYARRTCAREAHYCVSKNSFSLALD